MVPAEDSVHALNQDVYTTGRGGAGNMRSNTGAESTQQAQDEAYSAEQVDPENPTYSNSSIGRGGYGNVTATQHAENDEKKSILERMKDSLKR